MTVEEWRAAVAASRPALSPDQLAVLRPICQRMAQNVEAAPARQQEPHPVITEPERNAS